MGHKHSVYDSDAHFSIDPITRKIKNESSKKTTLVQGDHNSERCTFDVPRYIEGHDMLQCSEIEVHYDNFETGTDKVSSDYYEVEDKQISPNDENVVIFSWLIIDTATKYAGSLEFSIKFKCVEDGVSDYEWNTLTNTDLTVGKGKNNSGVVVERAPNVVDQWKDEIFGDAENAVANINLAEQNALAAVTAEGAAQVAAIQAEGTTQVENVKAAAEAIEADREQIHLNNMTKAVAIVGSAEGEVILLDDSAEQPFVEMSVFGKSTQKTTNGYQLLDHNRIATKTAGGCTVTNNGDGSFTISGSGNLTAGFNAGYSTTHEETLSLLKTGTLYLNTEKMSFPYLSVMIRNKSKVYLELTNISSVAKNAEITQEMIDDTELYIQVCIYGDTGKTIVPTTFKPMLYQDGDGTWEAFTGGIPSPNPEYPQEINNVENPSVIVQSKNLINHKIRTQTSSGLVFNTNDDGSITINGTSTSETYYVIDTDTPIGYQSIRLFASLDNTIDGVAMMVGYFTKDKTVVDSIAYVQSKEIEFIYPQEAKTTRTYIWIKKDIECNDLVIYPMIRIAEANETYEAPKEQSIQLPYTLHAIPVTSDGNCTDANGQEWISDEIDLVRGVYVQRIKCTEVSIVNIVTLSSGLQIGISKADDKIAMLNLGAICNKALFVGVSGLVTDKDQFYENKNSFGFSGTETDTLETLKEKFDGSELLYVLAEPIEIPLSEVEIEAFKALVTNYPYTTILNDSGANMAVKYGIDTKTYINKTIAEAIANISG